MGHPGQVSGGGAINKAKTHCKHGHEFSPENTLIVLKDRGKYRSRACRICREVDRQRATAKKKLLKEEDNAK